MELYILDKDGDIQVDKKEVNLRKLTDKEQSKLFSLLSDWQGSYAGTHFSFSNYLNTSRPYATGAYLFSEIYMPLPDVISESVKAGFPTNPTWLVEEFTNNEDDLFYDPTPRVFAIYRIWEGTLHIDSNVMAQAANFKSKVAERVAVELATQTIRDQANRIKAQDKTIETLYSVRASYEKVLTDIYKLINDLKNDPDPLSVVNEIEEVVEDALRLGK